MSTTTWTLAYAAAALWLLAWEVAALRRDAPGDTITEHLRRAFALRPSDRGVRGWQVRRVAALAILAWLPAHLLGWV